MSNRNHFNLTCQEENLILSKEQILLLLNLRDIHHNLISILDSMYTTIEGQVLFIRQENREIISLIHHFYHICTKEFKLVLDDEAKHVHVSIHYNFKHLFNLQMTYHPPGLGNRFVYRIKPTQLSVEDILSWLEISDEKKQLEQKITSLMKEDKIIKL